MPEHMDTKFNVGELDQIARYVNAKEKEQRDLAQLQAESLKRGSHGP